MHQLELKERNIGTLANYRKNNNEQREAAMKSMTKRCFSQAVSS